MQRLVFGTLLLLAVPARAADSAGSADSAGPLVRSAQAYVARFAQDMRFVIADERYDQQVRFRSTVRDERTLQSEVTLAQVRDEMWIMARHVLAVDGKRLPADEFAVHVGDARSEDEAMSQLRQLAEDGADWNIGDIQRNINTPALVLWFLTPHMSGRFRFRDAGTEHLPSGDLARVLRFDEQASPSLMKVNGENAPTTGRIWILPDSGAVVKTELILQQQPRSALTRLMTGEGRAIITVDYAYSSGLAFWLPSMMTERYEHPSNRDASVVTATARYSNYRQFVVETRIR